MLRGLLTVAGIVAPIVVLVALFASSARYSLGKSALLVGAALAFPALRLVSGLSVTQRASTMIGLGFTTGLVSLATFGFTSGPGVIMVANSICALIFLGRRQALLLTLLSAVAFLTVGILASHDTLPLVGIEANLNPHRMRNWARIGITSAFLTLLVTVAIDFIIRHVEATSLATSQALASLRIAHQRLGQLHRQLDMTKEEERRSLSHELHDELGQKLTALKLRLQIGERVSGSSSDEMEPLTIVDDLITRVREISLDLRPPLLDEVGLVSALRMFLHDQANLSGLAITLAADDPIGGLSQRLPADFEITCFRLVQESVTNVLRHAAARRVEVRVARALDRLVLSIRDDGRGLSPATLDEAAARGHLGVLGMRERVRARGGSFRMLSELGAGTTVEAELPTPPP